MSMEYEKITFTAVEFVDDPNVVGNQYWYVCEIDGATVGDKVIAPLGKHNNTQQGIIRKILVDYEYNAPYPMYAIKYIKKLIKADTNV